MSWLPVRGGREQGRPRVSGLDMLFDRPVLLVAALAMLWLPVRCGGRERGRLHVSRVDLLLGTLLSAGAAAALGTVAFVLGLAALALPRLLGAPPEAAAVLLLAGVAAGAATVTRARNPH